MNFRYLIVLLLATFFTACTAESGAAAGSKAGMEKEEDSAIFVDISPEEFARLMGNENTVILDVRTPAEVAKGKIDGSVNIDYRSPNFDEKVAELDPHKTYLVYCASGGRSSRTCDLMNKKGLEHVYNLRGGYSAWQE